MSDYARLYQAFAELLEYPSASTCADAAWCRAELERLAPGIAPRLAEFETYAASTSPGEMEEAYSRAFDFRSDSALYAGWQLLGADARRGMFLALLAGTYREHGFDAGRELPDHLPTLLRYLACTEPGPDECELRDACVAPAAEKIALALDAQQHPYGLVLHALAAFLEQIRTPVEV